jgi:glutamate synthase domain-containing protein 2/glutamate synthase domain-containing protein 1/glutamate synthase domain-containing protein 3
MPASKPTRPGRFGLYEPTTEHDACGVGFVAHILGTPSRAIVTQGLEVLDRLSHRGAAGQDARTGDGAGILVQLPHKLFWREGTALGFSVPRRRAYAVGMVFLPRDPLARRACEMAFAQVVADEGQRLLGWRDVPFDDTHLGTVARGVQPTIRQVFIARRRLVPSAFECKLYVIRKLVENRVRELGLDLEGRFHVASLSSETIVYKGLFLPEQLGRFYADLRDPEMTSAIAMVHSRFSTNTFPTWDLAQPFRCVAHNGEINTLQGNRNWMRARRSQLQSGRFWGKLDRLFPIIGAEGSDSAQFDNMVELLKLGGRSLPQAMMMMIPEAWENDHLMSPERRAYYEYAATRMEPWDGPAAICFTDGHLVGATLDRNGLRPCRYVLTQDDRVVMASEVGVLDIPAAMVRRKGRLRPGRMFIVDTDEGRILDDAEVKHDIVRRWPYRRWLDRNVLPLSGFPVTPGKGALEGEGLRLRQRAFGYTDEDVRLVIGPMAGSGAEPIGSMGNDAPLAVLSAQAPSLFDYFHQLFAQVTNPPIDPIREALVMSLRTTIGVGGNTFDETPEDCHSLAIESPVLTNEQLATVCSVREGIFEPTSLPLLYPAHEGAWGLERAVDRLCMAAVTAIDEGFNVLVLSDRGVHDRQVAIPILLAVSAVHQHLVREGIRMQAGLVAETAEAREVHHFALLLGYGAAAVNPYGALDTVSSLVRAGDVSGPETAAQGRYVAAVEKGLLKIMSKMGISTVQSYRGAQIFEAVGLDASLIEQHFRGTPSRLGGLGLEELGRELMERHERAFGRAAALDPMPLPVGGVFQWRRRGERHKWNPASVAKLQEATKTNDSALFDEYARLIDDETSQPHTLRGLLRLVEGRRDPLPLEEVEPTSAIVKRFVTGAMSFGSISAEAHETLAIAMNRLGGKSNSGEGGEEARRYQRDENGDLRSSAIKQIASARFGVTGEYLVNAQDLQIKISQGAKPGEGGQLPGHKVDERIAAVRCSTPGVSLISPPPHHDIYSIEDLKQLIFDLKCSNRLARVSVKLVSEVGVGTVAAGVAKAGADVVVIAGGSGGTGASPLSSIKRAGLPWELGLAETQQVLMQNGLRSRIKVQVDGGLRTGRDVVVAALLGGEEFGFATAALIVEGCIMLRKCHLNTCSVGIATQDPALRRLFTGQPDHVVNYFLLVAEQVRHWMARLGYRCIEDMVGRVDQLEARSDFEGDTAYKLERLDLSPLLARADVAADAPRRFTEAVPDPALDDHVDVAILEHARPAIEQGIPFEHEQPIRNTERTVGTILSSEVHRRHGSRGLVDGTIHLLFSGTAGQSFGAFLAKGITLELEGDANDYLGKGLSGGLIMVYPPKESRFPTHESVIAGNVVLYGATAGAVYIAGQAGERFAVRNSGARAVVEGVGDHGCEYMTGGVVVVLGHCGWNFAAGMSGGMAFVFDKERKLQERLNRQMVELEPLVDQSDIWLVYGMLEDHVRHTASPHARRILDHWELMIPHFVKVMPIEYRRALERQRSAPPQSRRLPVAPDPMAKGGSGG